MIVQITIFSVIIGKILIVEVDYMLQTSYSFSQFVKEYYEEFATQERINAIENEIRQFLKDYPLASLKDLTLEDYCRNKRDNENKPSFIRYIEYLTNGLQSSKTGSLAHRIFYESDGSFCLYGKYREEFAASSVEESFELFKERMINFINGFDPNNYDHFENLPSGLNSLKSKLIFLYRNETGIYGFSSSTKAKEFAKSLGIICRRDEDVIDVLVKIKKYIFNLNLNQSYSPIGIAILYWQYYINFVDLSDASSIDFAIDNKDFKGLEGAEKVYKLSSSKVVRSEKSKREALKRSGYTCEYSLYHKSFLKRDNKTTYLECHHLVPYNPKTIHYFEGIDLDSPKNIVSLCSECHNILHYGAKTLASNLLKVLFSKRNADLESLGISLKFKDLKKMYGL